VDVKVKMALERSQAIFKQIYGGESSVAEKEVESAKKSDNSAMLADRTHNLSLVSPTPTKEIYSKDNSISYLGTGAGVGVEKYDKILQNISMQTPSGLDKKYGGISSPNNLATSYYMEDSKLDESVKKTIENIKTARSGYVNSPYSQNYDLVPSHVKYASDLKRPAEVEEILRSIKIESLTKSAMKPHDDSFILNKSIKDDIHSAPPLFTSSGLKQSYTYTSGQPSSAYLSNTNYEDLKKDSAARIEEEVQQILRASFYKYTKPEEKTAVESHYNEGHSGFEYTLGRSSLGLKDSYLVGKESSPAVKDYSLGFGLGGNSGKGSFVGLEESSGEKKRYSRPKEMSLSREITPTTYVTTFVKPTFEGISVNELKTSLTQENQGFANISPAIGKGYYNEEIKAFSGSPAVGTSYYNEERVEKREEIENEEYQSPSKVLFRNTGGIDVSKEENLRMSGGSNKRFESPAVQAIFGERSIGGDVNENEQHHIEDYQSEKQDSHQEYLHNQAEDYHQEDQDYNQDYQDNQNNYQNHHQDHEEYHEYEQEEEKEEVILPGYERENVGMVSSQNEEGRRGMISPKYEGNMRSPQIQEVEDEDEENSEFDHQADFEEHV